MGSLDSSDRTDHDAVYRLIMAGWGSQVVRTLAQLSVAEHLEKAPADAAALAQALGSDPDMTYRLLRAAAAMGFLELDVETGVFSGTSLLDTLHGQSALSLKHYAQLPGSEVFWLPSRLLPETVLRGHNYSKELLGQETFEYFASHPDQTQIFSMAMTELSTPVIAEAVPLIDIEEARSVLDIGGADGAFVAGLLRKYPQLRGAVFDLPHVVSGVALEAERQGVADRMSAIAGDFFDEIPSADLSLLKFILHDWDDASCERILRNIARSMARGAKLIIVEMSLEGLSLDASLMDVAMMFAFTGREREVSDFNALLDSVGLRIIRTLRLHAPYVLIEAELA